MRSRAGKSSKIRVLGSLKLDKNQITNAFGCGIVFGEPVFKEIVQSGLKNAPKGTPNWTPKLAWCAARTPHFHPWVDKVAQVVTNGAQSGSRGAQSTPKRHLNGVKVGHKVSKTCSRSPNMMQNGDQQLEKCLPMGGLPLSYIYIYV